MKTYSINCKDFGRKFTFNAKDDNDAKKKLNIYEAYHSMYGCHTVELINEENPSDLYNEFFA